MRNNSQIHNTKFATRWCVTVAATFLMMWMSSCNGALKNWVCSGSTCGATLSGNDFLKSQILVSGSAVANGSDQVIVYLHLLNSDNTPVVNFQPNYAVTNPDGLIPSQCFVSDNTGLSICILKSNVAGQRIFQVTNISTVQLSKTILFDPAPTSPVEGQLVSGGQQQQVGSYSLSGSVGNMVDQPAQSTGHYVVYGSIQASVNGNGVHQ